MPLSKLERKAQQYRLCGWCVAKALCRMTVLLHGDVIGGSGNRGASRMVRVLGKAANSMVGEAG